MKKHLLIFVSLLLIALCGNSQSNDSVELERIYWNDWYRLEWSDFQANPEESKSEVAALSSIALPYSMRSDGEGELYISINVCFIKTESWAKEKQRNKVLLQHEQLHFDIAELHRRMIVKALLEANLTKENYKEKVEEIITKYWKEEYRNAQDKYDKETNYSQQFRPQINWNKFVEQELRNFEDYDFTELNLSLINFKE